MSKNLEIWAEIQAICAKAGLEPDQVTHIEIAVDHIAFEVGVNEDLVFHPWSKR